jgi:hypothetical protein
VKPRAASAGGVSEHVLDWGVALALAVAMLAVLLTTAADIGFARDEGFYFQAAAAYRQWFSLLVDSPWSALSQAGVDRYWAVNHEHPALMKSLMALSGWLLHERWGWVPQLGTAERLPGMVTASLAIAMVYLWGARRFGRLGAITGALTLAAMPRFFFHAHLACFDIPVASLWLLALGCWSWALRRGRWWRALLFAVVFGLLLDTKHNAWLLPPLLMAHWGLVTLMGLNTRPGWSGWRLPIPLLLALLVSPLILAALWPWLWFDTAGRVGQWWRFHSQHVYYNMEFLGRTWWKPPMPLGYAWVMTLATVPAISLVAALGGALHLGRRLPPPLPPQRWPSLLGSLWQPKQEVCCAQAADLPPSADSPVESALAVDSLLWLLAIAVSYAPWLLTTTPIFGGTKHWMTAYPPLALLAGAGAAAAWRTLRTWLHSARVQRQLRAHCPRFGKTLTPVAAVALVVSLVGAPLAITAHGHPNGLTTYTPLVGGAPGAASLGLNRTFWGVNTGSLQPYLADAAHGATVFVHDTAMQSWDMMAADGRVRGDLRPTLNLAASDLALYHHEPHMRRVEFQIWVDYATVTPAQVVAQDGVPIAWVYRRP